MVFGNLVTNGISPSEIEKMTASTVLYWNAVLQEHFERINRQNS